MGRGLVSYTLPPASAAARQRPASISAAVWLLYLVAVLFLINGVVVILVHSPMSEIYKRAFAEDSQLRTGSADAIAIFLVTGLGLALSVLFAVGTFVLAILTARGSNAARIVTWVVAGAGVWIIGRGIVNTVVGRTVTGFGGADSRLDPAEVQRLMEKLLPSWYAPVSVTSNVLQLLALLAIITLLALPTSNAFFWRPPR